MAEGLVRTGRTGRVAHHFIVAGLPSRAAPYVVRAVETAGALGAYRDALALLDGVREHAGPDALPRLLARRGDLLMALGDPEAVEGPTGRRSGPRGWRNAWFGPARPRGGLRR